MWYARAEKYGRIGYGNRGRGSYRAEGRKVGVIIAGESRENSIRNMAR